MLSWKICALQLLEDREKSDWSKSSTSFNSWALKRAHKYGKSNASLARVLRIVNFYESLREKYELPSIENLPDGVTGAALDDFARLDRVLTEKDRKVLVIQLISGNFRPGHTAPFLESYKKSMLETSTRGRPSLEDSEPTYKKHFQASLDAVALSFLKENGKDLLNPFMGSGAIDCTETRAYGLGLMPEKVWLMDKNPFGKYPAVLALAVNEKGAWNAEILDKWASLFTYLIIVDPFVRGTEHVIPSRAFEFHSMSTSFVWKDTEYVAKLMRSLDIDNGYQAFASGFIGLAKR